MSDKAETTKYIVYGSVAVVLLGFAYFGLIRPITNKLGLTDDRDDREGDRNREKIGRKQTLSPALWQKNKNRNTLSSSRANQLATQVFVGNKPWYTTDEEWRATGAIQDTGSLVNLSYLSKVFNDKFGMGMESFLEDFLEPEHWDTIDDYIDKTKKF